MLYGENHHNVKTLFYFTLLVSVVLFIAICSTTGMGHATSFSQVLGNFGDEASATLLVGYPIALALFYIGVSLHKLADKGRK